MTYEQIITQLDRVIAEITALGDGGKKGIDP